MSMARCTECERLVDTDCDGDFYYQTLEDGTTIETPGKCSVCRGE